MFFSSFQIIQIGLVVEEIHHFQNQHFSSKFQNHPQWLQMSSNQLQTTINRRRKPNLTDSERSGVIQFLLERLKSTSKLTLIIGAINECASKFNVDRKTISRMWKHIKEQKRAKLPVIQLPSKISQNSGRKPKNWNPHIEEMKEVPLRLRQTIRSLAFSIKVPRSTLFRILKGGKIKRISL